MEKDNNIEQKIDNADLLKEAAELGENLRVYDDPKDEEIKQLKDKMLRIAAEAENLKKRTQKEIDDIRNYSVTVFAKDLINVMDNLYRSLESLAHEEQDGPRVKAVIEGIEVIKKELENVFMKHSILRIEPKQGDSFDHNLHQAISQIPTDEVEEGKIYSLLQVGYSIKERLLRPALVGVAKNLPGE
jgi:molecular chaperone GrpE